jgi:hypothetical protein
MAAILRKLGFDVIDGHDLDRRDMENKIREFSRKIENADLALFYYAGHGLQVTGKNYLVPVDAKLEREGDLSFEAIDVDVVLQQCEPRFPRCLPQHPPSARLCALPRYSVHGCWDGTRLNPRRDRNYDCVCHAAEQRGVGWRRQKQSIHRRSFGTSPQSRRRHQ